MEIYEEKFTQQNIMREDKINQHVVAIKDLEREVELRDKRLRELQREKDASENKHQEEVTTLREEIELNKEKIME